MLARLQINVLGGLIFLANARRPVCNLRITEGRDLSVGPKGKVIKDRAVAKVQPDLHILSDQIGWPLINTHMQAYGPKACNRIGDGAIDQVQCI
jgi:hypothetical protein